MKNSVSSGHILTGNFRLNYRILGEGTPILVIGSSIYYPRLFSKKLLGSYQFIFLDHRGFAAILPDRKLNKTDYSLDTIIEDIEKTRAKLDLKNFIMVGHSGHAFMAMAYVEKYPEHVNKLALFNTAPTNSEERQKNSMVYFNRVASLERKSVFQSDISHLDADIARDPARRFVYMNIRMKAQSFYDFTFDPTGLWEGVQTNMDIIDYLWGDKFARLNLLEPLKSIEIPVFLGLGKYDFLVAPTSLWQEIDDHYPNIRKVIFQQSGHNPMLEEQERFDKQFSEWIES